MNEEFWGHPVREVMTRVVVTVRGQEKIEEAAELMVKHKVNALPVVQSSGACVGILTGQNLVEFEAVRKGLKSEWERGYFFDVARYGAEDAKGLVPIRYDEVEHHMSRNVAISRPHDLIIELAEKMCANHNHHAVVLDEEAQVCGIVSSLDILEAGTRIARTRKSAEHC